MIEWAPYEIQDLIDGMGMLVEAAVGHDLVFRLRVEMGISQWRQQRSARIWQSP